MRRSAAMQAPTGAPRCGAGARLLAAGGLLSAALLLAANTQLQPKLLPPPSATPLPPPAHAPAPLVAIADLHGDLGNALRSLQLSGVADADGAWVGGATHLVQTGDLVDRGDDSIATLQLFWRLRDEARAAGGDVTLLLGNHEIWAMSGEHSYVSDVELVRLGAAAGADAGDAALRAGQRVWDERFGRGGDLGSRLAETHAAAAVVGEGACRTLFVHAGLLPSFVAAADTDVDVVAALNARLAAALQRAHGPQLPAVDRPLFGERGPFWLRTFAQGPEAAACDDVTRTLLAVGATRMVVGHTVQPRGARTRCGGALVLLDTGISAAYYDRPGAWECRADGAAALEPGGRRPLETPTAA